MILNHVSLGVSQFEKSVAFYDTVLATLSVNRTHTIEGEAACYGDQFEFWIGCSCQTSSTAGSGVHIAFNATSEQAVEAFYTKALEMGGQCAGEPGLREHYAPGYFAAYVLDLDGNKIEAVVQL